MSTSLRLATNLLCRPRLRTRGVLNPLHRAHHRNMSVRVVFLKTHHLTKVERASDTAAKPEGKSLKISGTASATEQPASRYGTHTEGEPEEDSSSKGPSAVQRSGTHRLAQSNEEAKQLVRMMYHRMPTWKPPDCVRVLNA